MALQNSLVSISHFKRNRVTVVSRLVFPKAIEFSGIPVVKQRDSRWRKCACEYLMAAVNGRILHIDTLISCQTGRKAAECRFGRQGYCSYVASTSADASALKSLYAECDSRLFLWSLEPLYICCHGSYRERSRVLLLPLGGCKISGFLFFTQAI